MSSDVRKVSGADLVESSPPSIACHAHGYVGSTLFCRFWAWIAVSMGALHKAGNGGMHACLHPGTSSLIPGFVPLSVWRSLQTRKSQCNSIRIQLCSACVTSITPLYLRIPLASVHAPQVK